LGDIKAQRNGVQDLNKEQVYNHGYTRDSRLHKRAVDAQIDRSDMHRVTTGI
jgi:hypothetical protein